MQLMFTQADAQRLRKELQHTTRHDALELLERALTKHSAGSVPYVSVDVDSPAGESLKECAEFYDIGFGSVTTVPL